MIMQSGPRAMKVSFLAMLIAAAGFAPAHAEDTRAAEELFSISVDGEQIAGTPARRRGPQHGRGA
jgi:hypothetical protein